MAEPSELKFGEKIKQRRIELGMTQEELGNKLQLNKSTIQRYESGKIATVKKPFINAFAKALNLDPGYLFNSEQTKEGAPMDEKTIALIENLYIEQDTIGNLLKIFMDYIESEGLIDVKNSESEIIAATCFFNRLPMFFSLLYCVFQKVEEVKNELEFLLNEGSD